MNIVDYLIYTVGMPISRNNAKAILLDRSISESTLAQNLTERERHLLRADALMLVATFPSTSTSSTKRSGDFSVTNGGFSITHRGDLIKAAMKIYGTYGDEKYDESMLGTIRWEE